MFKLVVWVSLCGLWQLVYGMPSAIPEGTVRPHSSSVTSHPCSASSIPNPELFGAEITSLSAREAHNYSIDAGASSTFQAQNYAGLEFCQVNITYTHSGTNDSIHVQVWLPLSGWNQRFMGTGGGGYATGAFDLALAPAINRGYAAASTDGGHVLSVTTARSWALASPGNVNQYLLLDFASKSLHDMAVLGKAVTESFYGKAPIYSYWDGCSTGGRQGLMEAQRYPNDYNGILAAAPAINWPKFLPSEIWPQVVMNEEHVYPEQCEFDAITAEAVKACDSIDGVKDGIIAATGLCHFDPHSLVGQPFTCNTDGTKRMYSNAAATIVQETWGGPHKNSTRLWYGLNPGTSLSGLAFTNRTVAGTSYGVPFPISDDWIQLFVKKDPSFNTTSITASDFASIFHQSYQEYESIMGTDDPDLSAFRNAGGKMITWHGLADQLIFPNGTVDYYQRVMAVDPKVQDYYRLFLAPGVGHCGGGIGPTPDDQLGALIDWVEHGIAPSMLSTTSPPVDGTQTHRPLCVYPLVARWDGIGDSTKGSSYKCSASYT
ncbi:hypothetical protein LTR04_001664 [Oleoguttula sp. CCFEE 6159]|nr:hypothetical protein LTR04_001664 [Oleoguttula sp. CCFEE 6159]